MKALDLVSWLRDRIAGDEEYEVTDRTRRLANNARSDRLEPDVLATPGGRTHTPLIEYLADDEQPEYVFQGGRLLIADAEDSMSREYPTRKLLTLVSDRRILFVVGGRLADEIYEVLFSHVTAVYLDKDRSYRWIVVEAERDGEPMTFFADVTMESGLETLTDGVEYVRSRS